MGKHTDQLVKFLFDWLEEGDQSGVVAPVSFTMTLDEELAFYSKNLKALAEAGEWLASAADDPVARSFMDRVHDLYLKNLIEFVKATKRAFRKMGGLGSAGRFPIEHHFMIVRARAEETRDELARMKPRGAKLKKTLAELETMARDAAETLKKRAKEVGAWNRTYIEKFGLVPPWIEEK